jgi:hypothetical protein
LESSARNGYVIATRLYTPDRFSMAAGVFVPIDGPFLEDVLDATPQLARKRRIEEAIEDRRFAEAIYRMALADGVMERIRFQDVLEEAG